MQSLLLTGLTLLIVSRLELVPMIKAGEIVDYFFHLGSVIACSVAVIGVFFRIFISLFPIIYVGDYLCNFITILFHLVDWFNSKNIFIPASRIKRMENESK